ncbi:protein phosphatase 1 regulatory subunit 35 isoform X2 [Mesocricetus auratus]|uniref:Protein phosphatase 1 regulatory subunit 35 isoform X2 n=1 Tax=Mesocricetus auratus TaxID=10036 RepID=A0ABM2W7M3_MESAU|nr:protein phosphatase 1 regulatory subunit 35 isoform X2 [Mesocricetus auratus]
MMGYAASETTTGYAASETTTGYAASETTTGYAASELGLGSVAGEEAEEVPGPAPEPRAPEPEPGLDLSLSPSPVPASPERRGGSPGRRRRGRRRGRQVRFRLAPASPVRCERLLAAAVPSAAAALPRELEAPAPRSSLALSLELQSARAAVAGGQFDASKAVEEQLRKSFQTRCVLEEAVAEGLNVPRSKRLYRDLVSVQVPEQQVLDAALREKLAMLPPPPPPRAPPPKEVLGQGPDVTVLCNPDSLCHESPHLAVDGLPPLRLQARPRPSEDTFLMHRMLRRWEA